VRRGFDVEQNQAKRGRDREGDGERGRDGKNVGQGQRAEERSRQARQKEHRHEHQHDDDAGIENRAAHFKRRIQHDAKDGLRFRPLPVLPQAAQGVFHINDGVVHDLAERDDQSGDDDGVDGFAPPAQPQQGDGE